MKNFYIRNKQIFVTGAVIGAVFLLIILVSSLKTGKTPLLSPVSINESEEQKNAKLRNPGSNDIPAGVWNSPAPVDEKITNEETTANSAPANPPAEEEVGEVIDITFTDAGFSPKSVTAFLNQKIRWVNKSSSTLSIQQTKDFYTEFSEPVEITAGASMEFKLTKFGMWGYKDTKSGLMGNVFVYTKKPVE